MGFVRPTQLYPPQTHPFDTPSSNNEFAKKIASASKSLV